MQRSKIDDIPAEHRYGYDVFVGQNEGLSRMPHRDGDEYLSNNGWSSNNRYAHLPCFRVGFIYRRRIPLESAGCSGNWRLVGFTDVILQDDEVTKDGIIWLPVKGFMQWHTPEQWLKTFPDCKAFRRRVATAAKRYGSTPVGDGYRLVAKDEKLEPGDELSSGGNFGEIFPSHKHKDATVMEWLKYRFEQPETFTVRRKVAASATGYGDATVRIKPSYRIIRADETVAPGDVVQFAPGREMIISTQYGWVGLTVQFLINNGNKIAAVFRPSTYGSVHVGPGYRLVHAGETICGGDTIHYWSGSESSVAIGSEWDGAKVATLLSGGSGVSAVLRKLPDAASVPTPPRCSAFSKTISGQERMCELPAGHKECHKNGDLLWLGKGSAPQEATLSQMPTRIWLRFGLDGMVTDSWVRTDEQPPLCEVGWMFYTAEKPFCGEWVDCENEMPQEDCTYRVQLNDENVFLWSRDTIKLFFENKVRIVKPLRWLKLHPLPEPPKVVVPVEVLDKVVYGKWANEERPEHAGVAKRAWDAALAHARGALPQERPKTPPRPGSGANTSDLGKEDEP